MSYRGYKCLECSKVFLRSKTEKGVFCEKCDNDGSSYIDEMEFQFNYLVKIIKVNKIFLKLGVPPKDFTKEHQLCVARLSYRRWYVL